MLRLIFNLFEKKFIAHLNKKRAITLTKKNLTLSFHDNSGFGYYKFPKTTDLPISRLAKLQEFMMWLNKGVSQEEYIKALDAAEAALVEVLKSGKNASKIGFVLHELRDRPNMVVHDELYYNIIAVQLVRHDEDPTGFDNQVQMQKVQAFRMLDAIDDAFFLDTKEFLEQFGLSNITRSQLQELLTASRIARETAERMLKSL